MRDSPFLCFKGSQVKISKLFYILVPKDCLYLSLSGIGYNDNNERHNEWTTKKQYVYSKVNRQQWRPVSMYSFQSLSGIGYNDNNERHNEWTTKKQYVYFSVNRQQWRLVSMYSFQSLSGIGYNDNNERHNEWTTKKQYVYSRVNRQQWRLVSMCIFQSLSGIGYNVIMKDIMNEQQRNNMSILVSTGNNEGLYQCIHSNPSLV